jgi:hypothetical protein
MFEFQISALNGDRSGAIKRHADWIEAEASQDPDGPYPLSPGGCVVRQHLLEQPASLRACVRADGKLSSTPWLPVEPNNR